MAQKNVQPRDHIFIVSGNSHPVILRPSNKYANTWHAVGECYLHGFMHGEAVQNIAAFAEAARWLGALEAKPEIQSLKGTERNPRCDEITEQPDGLWKWLLLE